jgi:hypothetical protein
MSDDSSQFRAQAERLRAFLAAAGVDLKHTTSQQAVAAMHGAKDWRALLAASPSQPSQGKSSQEHYAVVTHFPSSPSVLLAPSYDLGLRTFIQEARMFLDVMPDDVDYSFVGQDIDLGLPVLALLVSDALAVTLESPGRVDGMEVVKGSDGKGTLAPAKLTKLQGLEGLSSHFATAVALGEAFATRTTAESAQRSRKALLSRTAHQLTLDVPDALQDLAVETQNTLSPSPLRADPRDLLVAVNKVKVSYTFSAKVLGGGG